MKDRTNNSQRAQTQSRVAHNPVPLGHDHAYSHTEFAALCGKSSTLLTKHEAATHLKVTPRYIERMVRAGRLRAYKPTGGLFRVRLCDLEVFVESGATIGGGE